MTWDRFARAEKQKCIKCGCVYVDAWVCLDCAMWEVGFSGDRWSNATRVSRWTQMRVDRAAAHEQWMDCVSAIDHGVSSADAGESSWASDDHVFGHDVRGKLFRSNQGIGRTPTVGQCGLPKSVEYDKVTASNRRSAARAVARRWAGFCRGWFALVDEVTSPVRLAG